jgi:hypothetical protein
MKKANSILSTLLLIVLSVSAKAFCGFYVAKADASLYNNKSQVILVKDGNKFTVTMSSDYEGNLKDFAMVIPIPSVIKRSDIRLVKQGLFETLDSYSAPRMAEYYDDNPCNNYLYDEMAFAPASMAAGEGKSSRKADVIKEQSYGVKVEAEYNVGEYTIVILSATESEGLKNYLTDNGYKIPLKATKVLEPYIKNNLKFFLVKVNLELAEKKSDTYLHPIQITYTTKKFMLPIRLGMANSNGDQDMLVYAFTKTGRVEAVNYRTVKVPTDRNIPVFIKNYFGEFYTDLFKKSWIQEGKNCLFLEYAWNVTPNFGVKCDPCVGPAPIFTDLKEAGVNWVISDGWNTQGNVFFTRLHVRYNNENFPQDLLFQETPNTENFQARYVIHNPATGDLTCLEGKEYLKQLKYKRKNELFELQSLTGWKANNYINYIKQFNYDPHTIHEEDETEDGSFSLVFLEDINNRPPYLLIVSVLLFVFLITRIKAKPKNA